MLLLVIFRWLERTKIDADIQNKEMEEFQKRKQQQVQNQLKQAIESDPGPVVRELPSGYVRTSCKLETVSICMMMTSVLSSCCSL